MRKLVIPGILAVLMIAAAIMYLSFDEKGIKSDDATSGTSEASTAPAVADAPDNSATLDSLDISEMSAAASTSGSSQGQAASTVPAESSVSDIQDVSSKQAEINFADNAAVAALTKFYSYLSSEADYPKALEMLDTDFKLKLGLLERFGTSEVTRGDIDMESASLYSDILKAAKLDHVVKYEVKDGVYTIYYYQTISLNEDSQVRMAMSAELKKAGKEWRLIAASGTDEME